MKKLSLCAFLLATLWCFPSAAQEGRLQTHDEGAAPERGHFADRTYINDSLGLTYQLPDGFSANTDLDDTLPGGSFLLMVADQHTGRPWKNRVLLVADDAKKYPKLTTAEYVAKYVKAKSQRLHAEMLQDGYRFEIAGKEFYRSDYKRTDNGLDVYEAFVCTKLKGYLLSWSFVSASKEELAQMASSIQSVLFRDVGRK
jgi:hypothetical protein